MEDAQEQIYFKGVMILGPNDITRLYLSRWSSFTGSAWWLQWLQAYPHYGICSSRRNCLLPWACQPKSENWVLVTANSLTWVISLRLPLQSVAAGLECTDNTASSRPHGKGRVSFVYLMHVDQKRSDCSLIVKSEYYSPNNSTLIRKNNKILLQWQNQENSLLMSGDIYPG